MRILLKFEIDCDPDAAWRALHSPRAVAELYGPLLAVETLEEAPTSFSSGDDVPVQMRAAGVFPVGRQLISVADRETADGNGRVRVFRDWGVPLTGPLAALDVWDHQMAVSAVPGDPTRTLWRASVRWRPPGRTTRSSRRTEPHHPAQPRRSARPQSDPAGCH